LSSKEPAKGIDDKRTHADIAEETRRKDKEEKEKNRVAVEQQTMTIRKMRKKRPLSRQPKGKKKPERVTPWRRMSTGTKNRQTM
jgi:predicted lipoprotein